MEFYEKCNIFALDRVATVCCALEYFEIDGMQFNRGADSYGVDVVSLYFTNKIDCTTCYIDVDLCSLGQVLDDICKLYESRDKAGYGALINCLLDEDIYVGGEEYCVTTAQIRDYLNAFEWCGVNEIIIDTTRLGPVRFEIYFDINSYDYEDEKKYCCYNFDEFMQFIDDLKGMCDYDDVESLWNFQYDLGC